MNKLSRTTILTPPNNAKKVLMHSCCAPCSGGIMESFIASKIEFTVLFYNPNIQPREEYEMRKNENMRFTKKMNIPFIDLDYEDRSLWFKRAKGLELVPERGQRCTMCFDMRFERSALFAKENGFPVFTSSLGISKWKDLDQVNASGMRSASRYPDLIYWTFNWRKKGGGSKNV